MKITPGSLADLFRLFRLSHGFRIFLRREYDRQGGKLQKLARGHRRFFLRRTRIVVVIGSLGKTTARRALSAALNCPDRNFSYSNYGSSLSENLLRIRPGDAHGVLEVGIAGPGPMAGYAKLIEPDIVVVTSIKSDHNRSFPTLLDTRAEKVKMVSALPPSSLAILNGDDPHVRWMATQTAAKVITFGFNADNDFRAVNVQTMPDGTTHFEVEAGGKKFLVKSWLQGRHMIYPVLSAVIVAQIEKLEMSGVLARLEHLTPDTGRMEIIQLPGEIRILNDTKKASLESIHAALEAFARMPATRKIVILGKVEEPVGKVRDLNRDLGERLAKIANLIICIGGDDMASIRAAAVRAGMDSKVIHLNGSRIAGVAAFLRERLQPGDLVLVKGASVQKLQRIVLELMGKPIACNAKSCDVKVSSCDVCPLLNASANVFKNRFISRYFKG